MRVIGLYLRCATRGPSIGFLTIKNRMIRSIPRCKVNTSMPDSGPPHHLIQLKTDVSSGDARHR